MNVNQAVDEVAKAVYCKYYHDNVCCITIRGISKKIRKEYDVMLKGKYGLSRGREGKDVEQLKEQLHQLALDTISCGLGLHLRLATASRQQQASKPTRLQNKSMGIYETKL